MASPDCKWNMGSADWREERYLFSMAGLSRCLGQISMPVYPYIRTVYNQMIGAKELLTLELLYS